MKRPRALLLIITVVLVLCAACGVWLHQERQQYRLNRQLVATLERGDTQQALALVNKGADPNTRQTPQPAPLLVLSLDDLLHLEDLPHYTPSQINSSPTAFLFVCGAWWKRQTTVHHLELEEENIPLLQAMLTHGADLYPRTQSKQTALHIAIRAYNKNTVQWLLEHNADINATDQDGIAPLTYAVLTSNADLTRFLLLHGAPPNAQDAKGQTPLYYAITLPVYKGVVSELLLHGANPNIPDKQGLTPLQLAQKEKHYDLVPLLEQHGAK